MLTLPASIHQPESIATMTSKQFIAKETAKVIAYSYPLLVRSNVRDTTKLLQIALIPPFLVYDGFKKDLYAAEVLERVLAMDRNGGGQEMTLHLQKFFLCCLLTHNANNTRPYVHSEIMMHTPSADATKWGNKNSIDCSCLSKKLQYNHTTSTRHHITPGKTLLAPSGYPNSPQNRWRGKTSQRDSCSIQSFEH